MRQLRLIGYTLLPSLISGALCLVASISFLLLTNRAFVTHSPLLYHYFFGSQGLVTTLPKISLFNVTDWWHLLYTNATGRHVVTYLLILLVTLVVFSILEGSSFAITEVASNVKELKIARRWHFRLLTWELWERAVGRVVMALAWLGYGVIFVHVLVPLCVDNARYGLATATADNHGSILRITLSMGALALALHLHIVCLRLLMLRPRVFGGVETLLRAEQK